MVEEHEAVALAATVLLVVTSIAAGLALWVSRSGGRVYRWTIVIVLSGLVAGTAAVAATAWTGGSIGHPEIR